MIHTILSTNPTKFLVRPVQRTKYATLDRSKLIYLVSFKSDLQQREVWAYTNTIVDTGNKSNKSDYLYSEFEFKQVLSVSDQNVYEGKIHLLPAGFWYYVIYEVYFLETITPEWESVPFNLLRPGYAPINGNNDFEEWSGEGPDPETCKGELGIIVEEGKLQVKRTPNEVTYTQHTQTQDNYIYNTNTF